MPHLWKEEMASLRHSLPMDSYTLEQCLEPLMVSPEMRSSPNTSKELIVEMALLLGQGSHRSNHHFDCILGHDSLCLKSLHKKDPLNEVPKQLHLGFARIACEVRNHHERGQTGQSFQDPTQVA